MSKTCRGGCAEWNSFFWGLYLHHTSLNICRLYENEISSFLSQEGQHKTNHSRPRSFAPS
jgi:hypothetical protein